MRPRRRGHCVNVLKGFRSSGSISAGVSTVCATSACKRSRKGCRNISRAQWATLSERLPVESTRLQWVVLKFFRARRPRGFRAGCSIHSRGGLARNRDVPKVRSHSGARTRRRGSGAGLLVEPQFYPEAVSESGSRASFRPNWRSFSRIVTREIPSHRAALAWFPSASRIA